MAETATLNLPDPAATAGFAARAAALAHAGDVIALRGGLGTGKSVFARGFVVASGVGEEVPSPTFTLVQTYSSSRGTIWHFDLYRLEDPGEAWELGIEDAFVDGISLIEWPERLGTLLPDDRLDIVLSVPGSGFGRRAEITGHGSWAGRVAALMGND